MSLWDSIRRLGEAGRRVVDKIDELEEEVRKGSPEALARAAANQPSERVLEGGVEALEGFALGSDEDPEEETIDAPTEVDDPSDVVELAPEDQSYAPSEGELLPGVGAVAVFGDLGGEITDFLTAENTAQEEQSAPLPPQDDDTLVFEEPPGEEQGTRYRNSLGFSDEEILTLFRVEHYPHLPSVDDRTLYRMARVEEDILLRSLYVGHAFRDAWRRVVPAEPLWEAAFWFTGVHRDAAALESLLRFEADWTDEAARQLGWAVWPYRNELAGAVQGLEDPAALLLAFDALREALSVRAALIRRGPSDLEVELDFKPVEQRGVFRFKGFRWLQ